MDEVFRQTLREVILGNAAFPEIVSSISEDTITYNSSGVWVDPGAPGFSGYTTSLTDEELVRAYLLLQLCTEFGYVASPQVLRVETVYKPVGRPTGKGGRADVLVRHPQDQGGGCFLFVECKTPDTYDQDFKLIDGQLFRLSLQELPRPRYLLYYTVDSTIEELRDRLVLIDTTSFADFDSWDRAGQPITDAIPIRYGRPRVKRFANVDSYSEDYRPLDKTTSAAVFNRLREEFHDVIWAGGGTNNNEVFTYIVKLLLCKIYDEKETGPGCEYQFQRRGDETSPESLASLVDRLNAMYRRSEEAYLALPTPTEGPAFDPVRLPPAKLAYVASRLEGLSVTENVHPGDLLGEFFEQIVSLDFTQSKGQFFTPIVLVHFMLALCGAVMQADHIMRHVSDSQGRPRLPYIIDPSCGSGTFLIEYMKLVTDKLGTPEVLRSLANRIRDAHGVWFGGTRRNSWAKDCIFGIETNYDLGLAAKANMVLHGDGSMNTWISSGLLPFESYRIDRRNNLLGSSSRGNGAYPGTCNGEFDLVISNPPFSLTLSPDENREAKKAFTALSKSISELVFIERWYQLLHDGGVFCCVLPETVLDTASNADARLFLLQHFRLKAIISLPYDAFRPFTSAKTCIVFAEKRTAEEALEWEEAWMKFVESNPGASDKETFNAVIDSTGRGEEPVFMAEPDSLGYKRRKGLPDMTLRNELFSLDSDGLVSHQQGERTVLSSFLDGAEPDPRLGFWTNLQRVGARNHLRLDPKYRWLWDYQGGVAHGRGGKTQPLGTIVSLVPLTKLSKGVLDRPRPLIDLESVERRQGLLTPQIPVVDIIGSEKVGFGGCRLAISKLEPYLGKVLIKPPKDAIGSTEWIGLRPKMGLPLEFVAHVLMLPDLCQAYRRLQSGKRHARFDPKEFLDLLVELPPPNEIARIQRKVVSGRLNIVRLGSEAATVRSMIDALFAFDA